MSSETTAEDKQPLLSVRDLVQEFAVREGGGTRGGVVQAVGVPVHVAGVQVPSTILRRESTPSRVLPQPEHSRSGQDFGLLAFELLRGDDASVA